MADFLDHVGLLDDVLGNILTSPQTPGSDLSCIPCVLRISAGDVWSTGNSDVFSFRFFPFFRLGFDINGNLVLVYE